MLLDILLLYAQRSGSGGPGACRDAMCRRTDVDHDETRGRQSSIVPVHAHHPGAASIDSDTTCALLWGAGVEWSWSTEVSTRLVRVSFGPFSHLLPPGRREHRLLRALRAQVFASAAGSPNPSTPP